VSALADLLQSLERRATEAEAIGATAPVASVYRALLAELAPFSGNGNGAKPSASPDTLLEAKEAARRLCVRPGWLYRHAATLPFAKRVGTRALRFSEQGISRWLSEQRP
jgi:predicted DNA-binding transcriptional regulator AlpA